MFPFYEQLAAQEKEREINRWYIPDYFKIQHAGNIGFMSIGLGYEWANCIKSDFIYGYVPQYRGNATIHTFTIKNTFEIYRFELFQNFNLSPIAGFSLSFEPGENSFMKVPEKYPEGYYGTNSFYSCLNLGFSTNFKFKDERNFSGLDIYCELNTLGDYLYYNIIAQEDKDDIIFSMALGVNVFF